MYSIFINDFETWRLKARALVLQNIHPLEINWQDSQQSQSSLFSDNDFLFETIESQQTLLMPKEFLPFAKRISCFRDNKKWGLLYQLLWRLAHDERHLMRVSSDPLIDALLKMEKAIRRDAHKMKAFVRFCKVEDAESEEAEEQFLAWYTPDHLIVRLVAPFFQRRFEVMRWTIVTPDCTVHWNGTALQYSEGQFLLDNPTDNLQYLWQNYYRAIFNPARIKIAAMKREMPVRFWHNLPETEIISALLQEAPVRVQAMIETQEGLAQSAQDYLPAAAATSIQELKKTAAHCQGCPLYQQATQTVFGYGNPHAKLVLVGEQPGDQEDLAGLPFVGPAGKLLRQSLANLSINEDDIYFTNAVKHFKFTMTKNFRLHRSPSVREINACKPWLHAELELIKPQVIVCLGLTAAKALINPAFHIKKERGLFNKKDDHLIGATYHPSAILRAPNPEVRADLIDLFERDLHFAYQQIS